MPGLELEGPAEVERLLELVFRARIFLGTLEGLTAWRMDAPEGDGRGG